MDILTNIAPGRLTQSKMICIKELVDSKLFKMPECRQILLPVFCQQIKDKLESKEEVRINSLFFQIILNHLLCAIKIKTQFIHFYVHNLTFSLLNVCMCMYVCVNCCFDITQNKLLLSFFLA